MCVIYFQFQPFSHRFHVFLFIYFFEIYKGWCSSCWSYVGARIWYRSWRRVMVMDIKLLNKYFFLIIFRYSLLFLTLLANYLFVVDVEFRFLWLICANLVCSIDRRHICMILSEWNEIKCFNNFPLFQNKRYDENGNTKGVKGFDPPMPVRLSWNLDETVAIPAIETAYESAQKLIQDIDLRILVHNQYGKGFMKTCGISPDAYIQMALQLAYYRWEWCD